MRHKGQTGILYVSEISEMERYIKWANQNGIRAEGFWSINARTPMTEEQLQLRSTVLEKEKSPHRNRYNHITANTLRNPLKSGTLGEQPGFFMPITIGVQHIGFWNVGETFQVNTF